MRRTASRRWREAKLSYLLKKPWRDGTVALVLEPMDLIARVCALIPPPPFPSLAMGTRRHGHMVRYHGVLSSHAKVRAEVVPKREDAAAKQLVLFERDTGVLDVLALEPSLAESLGLGSFATFSRWT